MPLSEKEFRSVLLAQLSREELDRAIVYAATAPISQGTQKFGATEVAVPWEAWLGFVDRDPTANWGHSARYILISIKTGEPLSIETRFSPIQRNASFNWRTIYQAPTAPDWAVAAPREE